jgi:hypothetical protein
MPQSGRVADRGKGHSGVGLVLTEKTAEKPIAQAKACGYQVSSPDEARILFFGECVKSD